jgi:signal peptidase I
VRHARGLGAALISLAGPGYGVAIAGRVRRAIVWPVAFFALVVACLWTPWATWAALLAYAGAAIDGYWCAARADHVDWLHPRGGAFVGAALAATFVINGVVLEAFKIPASSMYPTLEIGDHIWVDKLSPRWRAIGRGEVVVHIYPCDRSRDYVKRVIALGGDTVEVRCGTVYVNGVAAPRQLLEDAATCRYDDYADYSGEWLPRSCSRYREELDGHAYDIFHDPRQPDRERAHEPAMRDFPSGSRGNLLPQCSNASRDLGAPAEPITDEPLGKLVDTKPADDSRPCDLHAHYVVPDGHLFVMGDNRDNSNDSRIWGVVPERDVKGRAVGVWYSNGKDGRTLRRVGRIK